MIPFSSIAGISTGLAVFTLLVALLPAALAWWTDRRLLDKGDDPALPELLASRRRTNVRAVAIGAALMIVFASPAAAWGIPLLVVSLIAAAYPLRTHVLGETWGFGRYLWYTALSFAGGFGFWIALAYTPTIVGAIVRAAGRERWWVALAVLPVLIAWEEWYPRIWLWSHAAEPLTRADLLPRFEAIVQRAGTFVPKVYRVGAEGSRFVNALALPSVRRPAVAMGNALLDLLDPDETAAIFAHEVAHFDQFTPRRVRRAQLLNRLLIIAGVAIPLVVALSGSDAMAWIGWAWPLLVLLAMVRRAAKSQQHETESDLRAVALSGDPEALVRGLVKLHFHARIPRRWAVDVERVATHPSLVRRIQAIRAGGSTAAEQLEAATVVRSPREGSWIVLDDARAYWMDGVATDTAGELAALRDAASSYRAARYGDLVELRVGATGDTRAMHARTRGGDAWSVPIAADDVARIQRTLDIVDVRLGRAGASPARGTPRLIALLVFCASTLAVQTGILLVPIALALWKPGTAVLAALGAMSVARAVFGAIEGNYWWSERIVQAGLLSLAGIGVAALVVAVRRVRSGETDVHFRLTIGVLAAAAGLAGAGIVWQAAAASGTSLIGAPLVGTLATALIGIAAALFPVGRPPVRRLAYAGLVAGGLVGALGVDPSAFSLRRALVETSASATLLHEVDLGGAAQGLQVSPSGASFLATRVSAGRRPGGRAGLVLIAGRVRGPVREIAGSAAEFVDDDRLLVLAALGAGLELRMERADTVGPPIWADTLAELDPIEPRLMIDRDGGGWAIAGDEADVDGTVLVAGRIGGKGIVRRVVVPDTLAMMGDPIVFGPASTVIVPAFASVRGDPTARMWPLALLSGMNSVLRTELWRVRGDSVVRISTLRGPPQCGEPAGGVAACVARRMNAVVLYSVNAEGQATEIAQRPARDLGVVAVGPGARATAMTFERAILVADLAARRLTRIALPPKSEFAAEVRAGPGYVVTLSHAENRRSTLRTYRVQ